MAPILSRRREHLFRAVALARVFGHQPQRIVPARKNGSCPINFSAVYCASCQSSACRASRAIESSTKTAATHPSGPGMAIADSSTFT